MKQVTIAILAVFLLLGTGTVVFAKSARTSASTSVQGDFEIDGSVAFATGPGSFSDGYGINFGAGYMLSNVDKNLQARVDLAYYNFSYTYPGFGYSLSYTRVPVTFSARYYFPINDKFRAFAQAGIEASYDSYDFVVGGARESTSKFNLGISPGGGIEFFLSPKASLFAVARAHMISDDYLTMQFGGAFHF